MINMVSIASLTSELDSESDEGEEYRYEHNTKCSSTLLMSIDVSIKKVKVQICKMYSPYSFI